MGQDENINKNKACHWSSSLKAGVEKGVEIGINTAGKDWALGEVEPRCSVTLSSSEPKILSLYQSLDMGCQGKSWAWWASAAEIALLELSTQSSGHGELFFEGRSHWGISVSFTKPKSQTQRRSSC